MTVKKHTEQKINFIVYRESDGCVTITTPELEKKTIKEWIKPNLPDNGKSAAKNIEHLYDRYEVTSEAVTVSVSDLIVDF